MVRQPGDRERTVEPNDARVAIRQLEEASANPLIEVESFSLNAIALPAPSGKGCRHRRVDEKRDVGLAPTGRLVVQPSNEAEVQAAAVSLIRKARQTIAARYDSLAGGECGEHDLADMLRAARHEQKKLRQGCQRLSVCWGEQNLSHARADVGSARLSCEHDVPAGAQQTFAEKDYLGRLAGEVDALEDDQLSREVDGRPPPTRA